MLFSPRAIATELALLGVLIALAVLAATGPRGAGEWVAGGLAAVVVLALMVRTAGQTCVWVGRDALHRPLRRAVPIGAVEQVDVGRVPLSRWVPDHRVVLVAEDGELWLLPGFTLEGARRRARRLAAELGRPLSREENSQG